MRNFGALFSYFLYILSTGAAVYNAINAVQYSNECVPEIIGSEYAAITASCNKDWPGSIPDYNRIELKEKYISIWCENYCYFSGDNLYDQFNFVARMVVKIVDLDDSADWNTTATSSLTQCSSKNECKIYTQEVREKGDAICEELSSGARMSDLKPLNTTHKTIVCARCPFGSRKSDLYLDRLANEEQCIEASNNAIFGLIAVICRTVGELIPLLVAWAVHRRKLLLFSLATAIAMPANKWHAAANLTLFAFLFFATVFLVLISGGEVLGQSLSIVFVLLAIAAFGCILTTLLVTKWQAGANVILFVFSVLAVSVFSLGPSFERNFHIGSILLLVIPPIACIIVKLAVRKQKYTHCPPLLKCIMVAMVTALLELVEITVFFILPIQAFDLWPALQIVGMGCLVVFETAEAIRDRGPWPYYSDKESRRVYMDLSWLVGDGEVAKQMPQTWLLRGESEVYVRTGPGRKTSPVIDDLNVLMSYMENSSSPPAIKGNCWYKELTSDTSDAECRVSLVVDNCEDMEHIWVLDSNQLCITTPRGQVTVESDGKCMRSAVPMQRSATAMCNTKAWEVHNVNVKN